MKFGVNKHKYIFSRTIKLQFVVFKNLQLLITPSCRRIKSCYYLLILYVKKSITESQDRQNFKSMRKLFLICTCVRTLHLCYMRFHSFSANHKCIIFFMYNVNMKTMNLSWGVRGFNPFTPKIWLVILLTICHIILMMLVQRIWYWIN